MARETIDYILVLIWIIKKDALSTIAIPMDNKKIKSKHPRRRFELSECFLVYSSFLVH